MIRSGAWRSHYALGEGEEEREWRHEGVDLGWTKTRWDCRSQCWLCGHLPLPPLASLRPLSTNQGPRESRWPHPGHHHNLVGRLGKGGKAYSPGGFCKLARVGSGVIASSLNASSVPCCHWRGWRFPRRVDQRVNIPLSKSHSFFKVQPIYHLLCESSECPQLVGLAFPLYFILSLVVHNCSPFRFELPEAGIVCPTMSTAGRSSLLALSGVSEAGWMNGSTYSLTHTWRPLLDLLLLRSIGWHIGVGCVLCMCTKPHSPGAGRVPSFGYRVMTVRVSQPSLFPCSPCVCRGKESSLHGHMNYVPKAYFKVLLPFGSKDDPR